MSNISITWLLRRQGENALPLALIRRLQSAQIATTNFLRLTSSLFQFQSLPPCNLRPALETTHCGSYRIRSLYSECNGERVFWDNFQCLHRACLIFRPFRQATTRGMVWAKRWAPLSLFMSLPGKNYYFGLNFGPLPISLLKVKKPFCKSW